MKFKQKFGWVSHIFGQNWIVPRYKNTGWWVSDLQKSKMQYSRPCVCNLVPDPQVATFSVSRLNLVTQLINLLGDSLYYYKMSLTPSFEEISFQSFNLQKRNIVEVKQLLSDVG